MTHPDAKCHVCGITRREAKLYGSLSSLDTCGPCMETTNEYEVVILRRETASHTVNIRAESEEAARAKADAMLEEGDLDFDTVEVGDEWVESVEEIGS